MKVNFLMTVSFHSMSKIEKPILNLCLQRRRGVGGINVIKNQLPLSFGKICEAINYRLENGRYLDHNHFSCINYLFCWFNVSTNKL